MKKCVCFNWFLLQEPFSHRDASIWTCKVWTALLFLNKQKPRFGVRTFLQFWLVHQYIFDNLIFSLCILILYLLHKATSSACDSPPRPFAFIPTLTPVHPSADPRPFLKAKSNICPPRMDQSTSAIDWKQSGLGWIPSVTAGRGRRVHRMRL